MKCPSCGFENEASSSFCQKCGATMGAPPPGQPAQPPPRPPSYTAPPPPPPPRQAAPPPPRQAPPTGGTGQIDLGGWVSKAFNEVFSDFGSYLLIGLLVGIVSWITGYLLFGPLLAGSLQVIRGKLRGETPKVDPGSVFSVGFSKFGPTFLLVFLYLLAMGVVYAIIWIISFILALIPVIGVILTFILSLVMFVLGLAIGGWVTPFFAFGMHFIMEENMEFMDAGKKAFEVMKENMLMYWVFGLVAGIIGGIGGIACGIGVFVTLPVYLVMVSLMLENRFPKRR